MLNFFKNLFGGSGEAETRSNGNGYTAATATPPAPVQVRARAVVPPDVFSQDAELDQSEIALPLNEILPQINPALIARRQSQKQFQVPEDIHGPFGKDLAGVTLADPRTAAKAAAPAAPQEAVIPQ